MTGVYTQVYTVTGYQFTVAGRPQGSSAILFCGNCTRRKDAEARLFGCGPSEWTPIPNPPGKCSDCGVAFETMKQF